MANIWSGISIFLSQQKLNFVENIGNMKDCYRKHSLRIDMGFFHAGINVFVLQSK